MMGSAMFELYSNNYSSNERKNEKNDGNGQRGTILRNKKNLKKNQTIKASLPSLRSLLSFDVSKNSNSKQNYHSLSRFSFHESDSKNELLINFDELDAKDDVNLGKSKNRNETKFSILQSELILNQEKKMIIENCKTNSELSKNIDKNLDEQHVDTGKIVARFPMIFVGQKFLDKKFTLPMLPWIVAEYCRDTLPVTSNNSNRSFGLIASPNKYRKQVWFTITDRFVYGLERNDIASDFEHTNKLSFNEEKNSNQINIFNENFLFFHKLNSICKIQIKQTDNQFCFIYLTRDFGSNFGQNNEHKPFTLYIFECEDQHMMTDAIQLIKLNNIDLKRSEEYGLDTTLDLSKRRGSFSSSLYLDNLLENCQQYEVMYLGKVHLHQKRALPSFLDETIKSWKQKQTGFNLINEQNELSNSNCKPQEKENLLKEASTFINKPLIHLNDQMNRKLSTCKEDCKPEEENFLTNKTNCNLEVASTSNLIKSKSATNLIVKKNTNQVKSNSTNRLHLPTTSLITNTQSLDDATRASILNDLHKVSRTNQENEKQNKNNFNLLQLESNNCENENSNECKSIKNNNALDALNYDKLHRLNTRFRSISGDYQRINAKQTSLPLYSRPRTGSNGSNEFLRKSGTHLRLFNRTMFFLIGRFDLCLLSSDTRQILLNKPFSHVTHCCQGVLNADHFGFICKEIHSSNSNLNSLLSSRSNLNLCSQNSNKKIEETIIDEQDDVQTSKQKLNLKSCSFNSSSSQLPEYVGYVFKGEKDKLVNEIMYSLKQAFHNAHQYSKNKYSNIFCSECPLQFYHKLCIELQDASVEKAQCIILTRIGELSTVEQKEIMNNYEGVQVNSIREQNEILMSLLKRFYEKKQLKHSECKTNDHQQIRANRSSSTALNNLKQKAKKSISNSFETIYKLLHTDSNTEHIEENLSKLFNETQDEHREKITTSSTQINATEPGACFKNEKIDLGKMRLPAISNCKDISAENSSKHQESQFINQDNFYEIKDQPQPQLQQPQSNQQSTTQLQQQSITQSQQQIQSNLNHTIKKKINDLDSNDGNKFKSASLPPKSPLINIFMKIGNQNKSISNSEENLGNQQPNPHLNQQNSVKNSNETINNSNTKINGSLSNESTLMNHKQTLSNLKQSKTDTCQVYYSNDSKNNYSSINSNNRLNETYKNNEYFVQQAINNIDTKSLLNNQEIEFSEEYDDLNNFYSDSDQIAVENEENLTSWRKAIFSRIHSNTRKFELNGYQLKDNNLVYETNQQSTNQTRKRTKEELRELWRKAIYLQIILIKMEKENLLLQENQHEVEDKRLKLDYENIVKPGNTEHWTDILSRCKVYALKVNYENQIGNFDCFGNTQNFNLTKYSSFLNSAITPSEFAEAIQEGCPKTLRGDIWCLLADIRQRNGVRPVCSTAEATVDFNTEYRVLLQQLTSQQHAILVDLSRTFPKHSYYNQRLGAGQLALFNLLKAYSLFDTEVGYCQGLSFVAGILLIHMPEDAAFEMMKHLLFCLGLRKQYKPDMSALQLQLYQLTRLLFDHHRDIYEHFEKYEISPVLYATPWFLTLFASQFPIGFVSRLFDFIFLFGLEAIFRVSLSLLAIHKQSLLKCLSFESIIYYIKNDLVETEASQIETAFNIAFALDITRQLLVYEIEYQVIQEETQYKPLTIVYKQPESNPTSTRSISKNNTSNSINVATLLSNKCNSSSTTSVTGKYKPNQTSAKMRKISCSAIPQSYQNYKHRKISSSIIGYSYINDSIDLMTFAETSEKIKELEKENKNFRNRNMEILDQLHVAQSSVYNLESSLDSYKSTIKRLETRVRALEDERDALLHMVAK